MKDLPLSGSERKFTNKRWGSSTGIGNNNCYAYAVGDYEAYRFQKSIPGDRSGLSNKTTTIHTVRVSQSALLSDNPAKIYRANPMKSVKRGTIR